MSPSISQISCFSSIISNRRWKLRNGPYRGHANFGAVKIPTFTISEIHDIKIYSLGNETTPSYIEDTSTSNDRNSVNSYAVKEGFTVEEVTNGHIQDQVASEPKRAAKIHDFCLGIPFGGIVLSGGLVGFIFTRNPVNLRTSVLFGGALLALSIYSLKVWRQGKSSLPFILGQSVLSMALLWKNFQTYALTKKLFPTGLNAVVSAAMLCFYLYVVISGGNPPPKKQKSLTAVESS
ncbi:protein FATTY ACID EXPORT 1, chloroplastic isoform X2 [Henckelia pumila]|uniref:protein FATTY ACID EXPORT 1, chloroplastic isoform X2 n=1 Tax=Henckelia pumila TaxID=405737 RepID=UPI003C6E68C7